MAFYCGACRAAGYPACSGIGTFWGEGRVGEGRCGDVSMLQRVMEDIGHDLDNVLETLLSSWVKKTFGDDGGDMNKVTMQYKICYVKKHQHSI